jgi:hypothetical protein
MTIEVGCLIAKLKILFPLRSKDLAEQSIVKPFFKLKGALQYNL